MFSWLRDKLMIPDLFYELARANAEIARLQSKIDQQNLRLGAIGPGLGRIIAKLDPMYAKPEIDPARKAESDAIGDKIIEKLEAEHKARQHTIDGSY